MATHIRLMPVQWQHPQGAVRIEQTSLFPAYFCRYCLTLKFRSGGHHAVLVFSGCRLVIAFGLSEGSSAA
jgi:hypothetical protein